MGQLSMLAVIGQAELCYHVCVCVCVCVCVWCVCVCGVCVVCVCVCFMRKGVCVNRALIYVQRGSSNQNSVFDTIFVTHGLF